MNKRKMLFLLFPMLEPQNTKTFRCMVIRSHFGFPSYP